MDEVMEEYRNDLRTKPLSMAIQDIMNPMIAVLNLIENMADSQMDSPEEIDFWNLSQLCDLVEHTVTSDVCKLANRIERDIGEIQIQCPNRATIPFWLNSKDKRPEFSATLLFTTAEELAKANRETEEVERAWQEREERVFSHPEVEKALERVKGESRAYMHLVKRIGEEIDQEKASETPDEGTPEA
jgi:hypothetical protein